MFLPHSWALSHHALPPWLLAAHLASVKSARAPNPPSPLCHSFLLSGQHVSLAHLLPPLLFSQSWFSTSSAPVQFTQCADVTVQSLSQGPLTTCLNLLTNKSTHSNVHPVGCFRMECDPYFCLCLCFPSPCQVRIQCLINAGNSWISETLIFFSQSFIMWPNLQSCVHVQVLRLLVLPPC